MPKRRAKGEGSIYQDKRGMWRGAVTMPDGRRRYLSGRTRQDVAAKVQELAVGVRKGLAPQDGNTLLAAYLEAWVEAKRHAVRASTYISQEMVIRCRLVPELGRLRLVDLTARHVGTMMSRLQARGLASSSIALTRNVLHHAIDDAVRDGALPRNVVDFAKAPRKAPAARVWLDAAAARTYLEACRHDPAGPILQTTLLLGLRPGEAAALRWEDYSPERAQLEVRRTGYRRDKTWHESPPKTASGRRTLTIDPALAAILEAERARQQADGCYSRSGPMFTSPRDGACYSDRRLTTAHRRVLAAAGLPLMRTHDLRHSTASILLEQGVHVSTVAQLLGHANASITLNTYSHVIARLVDSATTALAGLLTPYAAHAAATDTVSEASTSPTL